MAGRHELSCLSSAVFLQSSSTNPVGSCPIVSHISLYLHSKCELTNERSQLFDPLFIHEVPSGAVLLPLPLFLARGSPSPPPFAVNFKARFSVSVASLQSYKSKAKRSECLASAACASHLGPTSYEVPDTLAAFIFDAGKSSENRRT